jgi:serine/threonine protein kinase
MELHYSFQNKTHWFMCMEFCNGGELFTLLISEPAWPEARVKFYAAEIVLALEYMHSNGVMHRDLKSENVLID